MMPLLQHVCNKLAQFTHISGHPSAVGRAQDSESSPIKDQRVTAVPRNQPVQPFSLAAVKFSNFACKIIPHLFSRFCRASAHQCWYCMASQL